MRDVVVAGVGQTAFGEDDRGLRELGAEAALTALDDSSFEHTDVDAAFVGNLGGPADRQRSIVGQYCLREAGITGVSITNFENACSSSAAAFHHAFRAVAGGFEDVALVLGVEKMTGVSTEEATAGLNGATDVRREADRGFTFPSMYGMVANAYEDEYDADRLRDGLTRISVKNHRNGLENPFAHYRQEIDATTVEESPRVAEPLRLYDMSPISDGAAAAVIASPRATPDGARDSITVDASVHRTGRYDRSSSILDTTDETATIERAYADAGIESDDVDLFEVHDASTVAELLHCESLGLCEPGSGPEFVLDGHTEVDGARPVNPSGGLKARGHPVGATGVAQINELVWQLRGEADGRQVRDPQVGLALNTGGGLNGMTANYTVHVVRGNS